MPGLEIIVPFFSLITLSFGMVDQIRLIYMHGDSKEVSFTRSVLGVINSILWMFYSKQIHNEYLFYTNIIALILGIALSVMVWRYH